MVFIVNKSSFNLVLFFILNMLFGVWYKRRTCDPRPGPQKLGSQKPGPLKQFFENECFIQLFYYTEAT